MKRRRLGATPLENPEFSLTPLIDTVLVLLVTFMIAMPVMQNAINIELPSGAASDEQEAPVHQQLTVSIGRDPASREVALAVNNKVVSWPDLIPELERNLGNARDQVVVVKADQSIFYREVAHVIDDIKYLGGVRYVALATEHA